MKRIKCTEKFSGHRTLKRRDGELYTPARCSVPANAGTDRRILCVVCRGSFTLESAFLYPVIVILIAFMLYLSVSWYQNVRQAAEDTEELLEMDMRAYFLDNVVQVIGRGIQK